MSTQKISCLAVELKIFYASDADDTQSGVFCRSPNPSNPPPGRLTQRERAAVFIRQSGLVWMPTALRPLRPADASPIVGSADAIFNLFPRKGRPPTFAHRRAEHF